MSAPEEDLMRTLRRLGRLLPALALAAAVVLAAVPARADTAGPRTCTGQPGQQPDPTAGDGTSKISVCVKVVKLGGGYHAAVDMHYWVRVGGVWQDGWFARYLVMGKNTLRINNPDLPGPVPLFSYGSFWSNGSDIYSCWEDVIGTGRSNCVAPYNGGGITRATLISTNYDLATDFDIYANAHHAHVAWIDHRGIRRPGTGYVDVTIASPWWS
jgi:hypothetical protein